MPRLNLPEGSDTGFRLELWDAFENRFTSHIYGAGRKGWFLAARKWFGGSQSIGPQPLARGRWREFLGLVKQSGFWDLPSTLPRDPELETEDGEWMSFAGRNGDHYHQVNRDGIGGGLFQVQRFLTRLSGFFAEPRPTHPSAGIALEVKPPDVNTDSSPDTDHGEMLGDKIE
jgi:hypothetical protein